MRLGLQDDCGRKGVYIPCQSDFILAFLPDPSLWPGSNPALISPGLDLVNINPNLDVWFMTSGQPVLPNIARWPMISNISMLLPSSFLIGMSLHWLDKFWYLIYVCGLGAPLWPTARGAPRFPLGVRKGNQQVELDSGNEAYWTAVQGASDWPPE